MLLMPGWELHPLGQRFVSLICNTFTIFVWGTPGHLSDWSNQARQAKIVAVVYHNMKMNTVGRVNE